MNILEEFWCGNIGKRSFKNMRENMELGIPVIEEIWESVLKM